MVDAGKKQLILTGAMVLLIALTSEAALRIAHVAYDASLYTGDQQRGWTLRAGAEGWVVGEAKQYVRINRAGFRDRQRNIDKPARTLRVAVLGNSWTEALQVPLESTFCAVVERELASCAASNGRQVEVLNFGTSGYSSAQELLTLRLEVWKYRPDIVLLAFYTARDVLNNVRAFNNVADPAQSPYFVYADGRLTLDDSFRRLPSLQPMQIRLQNFRDTISDHLLLFRTGAAVIRSAKEQAATNALAGRAAETGVDSLENAIYSRPAQPAIEDAWRVTEGIVLAIRDEVRVHGAQFRIATLANRPQVMPDPAKRREFIQKLGLENLDYADMRIKALADREGIALTILAKPLSAFAETHQVFLNGFQGTLGEGHWNELGHRLAGERIAADLSADVCGKTAAPPLPDVASMAAR
jgi:hypothetical protein